MKVFGKHTESNGKRKATPPKPRKPLTDNQHCFWAGVLLVLGLVCLAGAFLNSELITLFGNRWSGGVTFWAVLSSFLAGAVILLVDFYAVTLMWIAAYKATPPKGREYWPGLPNRKPALVILLCLFLALISAFAHLYIQSQGVSDKTGLLSNPLDAFYFSMVTITTLGYGDYAPFTHWARAEVMLELFSGLLFLLLTFPVLASRLADFGQGERILEVRRATGGWEVFNQTTGAVTQFQDGRNLELAVTDDGKVTVEVTLE